MKIVFLNAPSAQGRCKYLQMLLIVFLSALCNVANAHPMGNFSINHLSELTVFSDRIEGRYLLDFAEIPTVSERAAMGVDGNDKASEAEKTAYLARRTQEWGAGLKLKLDNRPQTVNLKAQSLEFKPGAGNLPTLRVDMKFVVPVAPNSSPQVSFEDTNYDARTGWKDVVVRADKGAAVRNSDAPTSDESRELTQYSPDVVPPQRTTATFVIADGATSGAAGTTSTAATTAQNSTASADKHTPHDAFTEAIAREELTPGVMLIGLALAFGFGALHALSPGHGKTMVAAYLVGQRGTLRHAALLGIIVTVTHTLGVFALGVITLLASNYIVPERLFPMLGATSGMMIFAVGIWLLSQRTAALRSGGHSQQHHDHSHGDHDHSHDEHSHDHDHDGHSHGHHHGPGGHTHAPPEGPITVKTLLALGVSGGIVPCPSALVVLLSAIALHRIAYGLAMIVFFSLGLAAVLIVIGMMVVSARGWLSRFEGDETGKASWWRTLTNYLPIGSAAVITVIGVLLTLRALGPGAP